MNSKWIPIKERKPDRSRKNILVKTKDGKIGFAYYERYLPKELDTGILPRGEFLEKAEQFFTGIPVEYIRGMVIIKRYNPDDIEYWMNIKDAVDENAWKSIADHKTDRPISNGVLIKYANGEINIGCLIRHRVHEIERTDMMVKILGRKTECNVYSDYAGSYEDLIFLAEDKNVIAWQYFPD